MNKLLSVEFTYGLNTYYALVRLKHVKDWKEYFITIVDEPLHEFVGKEIYLMEKDGQLINPYDLSKESGKILNALSEAIHNRLNEGTLDNRIINRP